MPAQIDADTRAAIELFLARARLALPVSGALLFGSRARGDHGAQSDADVAVFVQGEPRPFIATKLALADIAYDVLLENGILIQPLPIWDSEWREPERYPNPSLLANIRRDGVPL